MKKQSNRSKCEDAVTVLGSTEEFQNPAGENAVLILRQILRGFAPKINRHCYGGGGEGVLELGWTLESLPAHIDSLQLMRDFLTSRIWIKQGKNNEPVIEAEFRLFDDRLQYLAGRVLVQQQRQEEENRLERLFEGVSI